MNIFSQKIQLLISENEALQKEQDRLTEVQTKIINESRKREQDLRKQVEKEIFLYLINTFFCLFFLKHQIELDKMENECLKRTNDSHDMMKNVTLQNETLSSTFKVIFKYIFFSKIILYLRNK
jgi:DNA repair exonuclease SbcCD ATPase subunit